LSSPITPSIASAPALLGIIAEPKPTKIEDAARQFESILIAQMLRSGRESASALGDEDESDSGGSTMIEVAEQQFAQMLAKQGGIGLTQMVVVGLKRDEEQP
jgi:Rod binding domain-containing protein